MELRHLRYFAGLAIELHFRNAAEKLCIAQPALSRQIKALENELGVRLFHRTKRKVSLTEAGKHLQQEVTHLFDRLEETKRNLKRIEQGRVGEIRLGYVGSAMHHLLPVMLASFKGACPDVCVRLSEMTTQGQVEAVKNNQLDVGFVRLPINSDGLEVKTLLRECFSLVLPENHRLVHHTFTDLAVLAEEPFILFSRHWGQGHYDKIISLCNRASYSPKIAYETVEGNAVMRLVENGLGISILPASIRQSHPPRVKFIELDFTEEKTELAIIYPRNTTNPIVHHFVRHSG